MYKEIWAIIILIYMDITIEKVNQMHSPNLKKHDTNMNNNQVFAPFFDS